MSMKKRGLLIAATAHAGMIALACSFAYSGIGVQPQVAQYATQASLQMPQRQAEAAEHQPVDYPEVPPAPQTEPGRNPLELDASDALPKSKPKPRAVPPQPLTPPADVIEQPPLHVTGHFAHKETEEPTPVDKPIENAAPVKEIADRPNPLGNLPGLPQIQHPPKVVGWDAPPDVRRGFRGRVVAVIQIDEHGKVTDICLDPGTGNKTWDRQLRNAFRKAEYKPATLNGKPVASELRQPVDFE